MAGLVRAEGQAVKLGPAGYARREARMSAEAVEMVTIPRAELDALKAELRRLRREAGRVIAKARIEADLDLGSGAQTFTREQLAEAWGIRE